MLKVKKGFKIAACRAREYKITVDKKLGRIIRGAARAWLQAVITAVPARDGFPVVTGAAISTLKPLSRYLGRPAVNNTPRAGTDGRYRGDRRDLGTSHQTFKIVDDNSVGRKFIYSFEWSTDLYHYVLNETKGYIPHAPWNTMEAGESAFLAYLEEKMADLPEELRKLIRFT